MGWWKSRVVLTLAMTPPVLPILASGRLSWCRPNFIKIKLVLRQALHRKLWLRRWLLWRLLRGGHERGEHMKCTNSPIESVSQSVLGQ